MKDLRSLNTSAHTMYSEAQTIEASVTRDFTKNKTQAEASAQLMTDTYELAKKRLQSTTTQRQQLDSINATTEQARENITQTENGVHSKDANVTATQDKLGAIGAVFQKAKVSSHPQLISKLNELRMTGYTGMYKIDVWV